MGECFFWYRPTRVIPDKRPLNGGVCVCACVRACVRARARARACACACARARVRACVHACVCVWSLIFCSLFLTSFLNKMSVSAMVNCSPPRMLTTPVNTQDRQSKIIVLIQHTITVHASVV